MKVDVIATTVIERPIAEVAAYTGDPSNAPHWYRRIRSAEWQTEPPMRLGSQVTFRATFLGRDLEYTYIVTEYTPGEQVSMRTQEGPFPMSTTYTWRPLSERATHMTLRNQGEPRGFGAIAAPLMRRAMARAMRQDLAGVKRLLEARR